MFEERIAAKPVELSENIIETFQHKNRTFFSQYQLFVMDMKDLLGFVGQTERSWNYIKDIRDKAVLYLNNKTKTKTEVAAGLTSKQMEENVRQLELFMSEARSRSHLIVDSLSRLRVTYKELWHNMLTEPSTRAFYRKWHEDVDAAIQNKTIRKDFQSIFESLANGSKTAFTDSSDPRILLVSMNADFAVTSYANKSKAITDEFEVRSLWQQNVSDMTQNYSSEKTCHTNKMFRMHADLRNVVRNLQTLLSDVSTGQQECRSMPPLNE